MSMSIDGALGVLAERTADIAKDGRQAGRQRRNQVVDIFGMEFTRQGDTNNPAVFYVSVSPDLIYYERFEFKLIISSFAMPLAGSGSTDQATVAINAQNLTTTGTSISPNPHGHTTQPHRHSVVPGVSISQSHVSNAEIWIEGVNVTQYLKDQHGGAWINGEGIFPGGGFINYDILGIIGKMPKWQQGLVLKPGYKPVEIRADGIFNVTLVNYLKYSHVNR